ncbi:sulfur carrier protein ThiS adenylyltransferase ThiF [Pseudodesulfovibrio sediminis]|uniref:Thiamine biosynthesis protein ThiF n=1 Tax=Pseudodesulfovibrio sediminis TaxID=2810563 RepID=A0ABN6EQB1_9BACT|nr:sulfur carrier protein ThiS adenylyltransferase ThiF [Pseudodesulfovibrio sediminis]BCS87662.1 thiamine biosynthesis protein ThiF [Pseudodesulfovibrio sediminis]
MNRTEQGIAVYLGEDCLEYLQGITVGIAGAGGLGSNCAMHLVRSGFRRFVLVDFDRVELSNLNRQAFTLEQVGQRKVEALAANMMAVNPDCECDVHDVEVTADNISSLFDHCSVVVEAFDAPEAKKALVEKLVPTGKLVVAASGMGGVGEADALVTRKVRDTFYLVGDGKTACAGDTPPMSPKVGIAAAKQADVVLGYFLQLFDKEGGR